MMATKNNKTKYVVTTRCSIKAAGKLTIQLHGENGSSKETVLKHGLERIGKEELIAAYLGELKSVKFAWQNDTGKHLKWQLDSVEIVNESNWEKYKFVYERPLTINNTSNKAELVLSNEKPKPAICYESFSRTPTSLVVKGVRLDNFADKETVTITYSCPGHKPIAYTCFIYEEQDWNERVAKHELIGYGQDWTGTITARASDRNNNTAECSITVNEPGPFIEPITSHTRTSVTTATIPQVKCRNFPDNSKVCITYYDGEDCLGEFDDAKGHRLTKLQTTTEIQVTATDDLGNVAETTYSLNQNIPTVSYGSLCRTPNSILIKGLKVTDFPKNTKTNVTCTCDGQKEVSFTLEENGIDGSQCELFGYDQRWGGGTIKVTASDVNNEYQAECDIVITRPGPCIEPVTDYSRTSISTATIRQIECKNFPADTPIHITYYDGEICLGNFLTGEEHEHTLTILTKDTTEIKVQATDDFGNIAEGSFNIDANIPTLSYEGVSRTPISIIIKGVLLVNFQRKGAKTATFECDGHDAISHTWKESESCEKADIALHGYGCEWAGGTVVAKASDGTCKAQSEIIVEGVGPTVEPITDHTRTSLSTATVRQVEYSNFPAESQRNIQVSYYDGDECLGQFYTTRQHKLTKLKKSTSVIKVQVKDNLGNMAETKFEVNKTIPEISYESVTRTPISIVIEGVKVTHFPSKEELTITYTSNGHRPISHVWKQNRPSGGQDYTLVVVHELSGYSQSWGGGVIVATCSDGKKEFMAQCYIHIAGQGQMIEPITNHIRTSETTVIIKDLKCKNFPQDNNQIQITYYDRERYLGTFPLGKQHRLRKLEKSTKEIKVRATDDFGNVAETKFDIDQNIPNMSYGNICRTPTSVVVKDIVLENFPIKEEVTIIYECDGMDEIMLDWKQGKAQSDTAVHELSGYGHNWTGGTITATARDLIGEYKAICEICIEGTGPKIEPISNHTRTSVSTATVRNPECNNFPKKSQVYITYYDGQVTLGKFSSGKDHKLTNLKTTTKEIKVQAMDQFGNVAETLFELNQNIPNISYEYITRNTTSIFIKGVKLTNFPIGDNTTVRYTCERQEDVYYTLEESQQGLEIVHELPGYDQSFGNDTIVATVSDERNEYRAECKIDVHQQGPFIQPITDDSRTSVSTATVRQFECHNFPPESQVYAIYFDGDEFVGKFPIEEEHRLTNLNASSREIQVHATDDVGNAAESTFIVDQNIPAISYKHVTRTPTSVIIKGVQLMNFITEEDVNITYSCSKHGDVSFSWNQDLFIEHELDGYDSDFCDDTILVSASSTCKEYSAECSIAIQGKGPSLEPVTDHTRTSINTATVRHVRYQNFPNGGNVYITYYDGKKCLGKFPVGKEHNLTNLKPSTKEVRAMATDVLGNVAESIFVIDQNIPAISYQYVSRTPTSLIIKGLMLRNFPNHDDVKVTYSGDSRDAVTYPWNDHTQDRALAETVDHELPGYDDKFEGGRILVTAADSNNEFRATCEISIKGRGPRLGTITKHSRTSITTATVRQVQCKNFPADSQVCITYYDGGECLGKFPIGDDHKLTNLKESSKEIQAHAADKLGNVAEASFIIDRAIPTVSYEYISRTPKSLTMNGLRLTNFPSEKDVTVTYVCDGRETESCPWTKFQQPRNSHKGIEHELPWYNASYEEGIIVVNAADESRGYNAQCEIQINNKGPSIDPITNHSRTSVDTAAVRQVQCKNFPEDSQVYVIYYDGEDCLGKFSLSEEHHLTNLKASSKEIRVLAGDEIGNIAETTFTINQNIPAISYGRVSRTPKSIFVKDVKLVNFPDENDITICYSCAGQAILHTWKQDENDKDSSSDVEHELPAYYKGNVIATAIDATKEYRAQCHIKIEGEGPQIVPITNSTRTSVSTAKINDVKCKNFPAGSQLSISYYDGQECLGKFQISDEHRLTKLNASTKDVTARVRDEFGNVTESTFIVNQNIPSLSYDAVSRTPKSMIIKGVKLLNFPNDEKLTITYSCTGHDDVSHIHRTDPNGDENSAGSHHELSGFDETYTEGTIIATAKNSTKEYSAECQIRIHGKGPYIEPITDQTRTSVSMATVRQVKFGNFPDDSQVSITYYGGDECLGKFSANEASHVLTNLKTTSKEVKVTAADDVGNVADAVFTINQNIPTLSFAHVARTPRSVVVKDVKLRHFPNSNDVNIIYSLDGQENVSYVWKMDATTTVDHELTGYGQSNAKIMVTATDVSKVYKAQCEIDIIGEGPLLEPITIHTRTSVSTATIPKPQCGNFPDESQIYISYYDNEACLGKFSSGVEHRLSNLKASSKEIRVQATDMLGNIAKTTFNVDHNIPTVSYEHISRTPTSVVVNGLKLAYFPEQTDVHITYSCEGREPILQTWRRSEQGNDLCSHTLKGYNAISDGSDILVTVVDATKEYRAECQIKLQGQGPIIETISDHIRTSISTATVRKVEYKNFPDESHLTISYYDGEECLGKFPIDDDHKLTKLNVSSKEITVQVTDTFGNTAETTFQIDQKIPTISYENVARTPTSLAVTGVQLRNFPSGENVSILYSCDGHDSISYTWKKEHLSKGEHEFPGFNASCNEGDILVTATDGSEEYTAECHIIIDGYGPSIEPVTKHSRTSVTTATVHQVQCKSFPAESKVNITYFDGTECLGKFHAEEHHLTNLKSSTKEIKVQATDDFGNIAEREFDINQNIPTISYERISRTPASLVVKNVKLLNFLVDTEVKLVYSCDGYDDITYTWNEDVSSSLDFVLPGYNQRWDGGTILIQATCCNNVYRADCHIDIEGQGPKLDPITSQTRTSISTATVKQVECKNFPADSKIYISYFEGDELLGKFKIQEEHKLTKLTESSTTIRAEAVDEYGNTAEATFNIDSNIPAISYEHIARTPTSILIRGLRVNFPTREEISITYSCDGHEDVSYTWKKEQDGSKGVDHELDGYTRSWEGGTITTVASDCKEEYVAECQISVEGSGPFIEPIVHHSRTSVTQASVYQVQCKNFPSTSQVEISYFDGEACLGKFPVSEEHHSLMKLTTRAKTITVKATDVFGNSAETTFDINQNLPSVSYENICRTPTSVIIRGVKLENFPETSEVVTFTYSSDGHDTLSCKWSRKEDEGKPVVYSLPGYAQSWNGGIILMTATDGVNGYYAETPIRIEGTGPFIQPTINSIRTSVSNATVPQLEFGNFPDDSKMHVKFYDEDKCIGNFPAGKDYKLTNLKEETKEVIVQATDGLGNVAASTFTIDQKIPSISYQAISRTETSVVIQGLQVEHFPDKEGVSITYSWEGRELTVGFSSERELPDVDPDWNGVIVAVASDANGEFSAECQISVKDPEDKVEPETHFLIQMQQGSDPENDPLKFERKLNKYDLKRLKVIPYKDLAVSSKLRIWDENTGIQPRHEVEDVKIVNRTLKNHRKFSRSCSSLNSSLNSSISEKDEVEESTYKVTTQTASTPPSSNNHHTDANVFIQIIGKKRTSDILLLKSSRSKEFKEAKYTIQSVGGLKQLRVWHDRPGESFVWHLDNIVVVDEKTGKGFKFDCNRKMRKDGDDKQIMTGRTTFKITVDIHEINEGFIQSVTDNSSASNTSRQSSCKFESDQMYVFYTTRHLGDVNKVRILYDNKGYLPGWDMEYLNVKVRVSNEATRMVSEFGSICFVTEDEYGHIVREMTRKTDYDITLKTSAVQGGGTDANVYIQVFGENGTSDELRLKKSSPIVGDKYKTGEHVVFTFQNMPSLGVLKKLQLRVVKAGRFGSRTWHLEYIRIDDLRTTKCYMFRYNRWLRIEDDKKECRVILQ